MSEKADPKCSPSAMSIKEKSDLVKKLKVDLALRKKLLSSRISEEGLTVVMGVVLGMLEEDFESRITIDAVIAGLKTALQLSLYSAMLCFSEETGGYHPTNN